MTFCLFRFPYYSDKEENKTRVTPDVTKAFVKYGISLTLDQDINESIESQERHFYTFYYRLKSWKSAVYFATTFVTLFFIGQ